MLERNIQNLDKDTLDDTISFLDQPSLSAFSQTSTLFSKMTKKTRLSYKLMWATMQGESDCKKVLEVLGQFSQISSNSCIITLKISGAKEHCRHWTQPISALQFAAWAGDLNLVELFLTKMPHEYSQIALRQLRQVRDHGLEHGGMMAPYLDFTKTGEEFNCESETMSGEEQDQYCIETLGGKQFALPRYGIRCMMSYRTSNDNFNIAPSKDLDEKVLKDELGKTVYVCNTWCNPNSIDRFNNAAPLSNKAFWYFINGVVQPLYDFKVKQLDQHIQNLEHRIKHDIANPTSVRPYLKN